MKVITIAIIFLVLTGIIFAFTGFGESEIFEISSETLPVELSSFTAAITAKNFVQLHWVTETETNLAGYYIYRNEQDDLNKAVVITRLIEPANTSQRRNYTYLDEEVLPGITYYYWLQSMDLDLTFHFYGPISVLVDYEEEDQEVPSIPFATGLKAVYPNPFNPSTTIGYQLAEAVDVQMEIYNIRGQIIQRHKLTHTQAGNHSIIFDGRDVNGKILGSGLYFVVMKTADQTFRTKMVLIK